tara:strand:+ start:574 stop:1638 length:1065 start_codon:yes stop_codon:yes gene_type:complete
MNSNLKDDFGFSKEVNYTSRLLIVTGYSGSGKTLTIELLKAIENIQTYRIDLLFDHLPILHSLGKIETSSAKSLIKQRFDQIIYNNFIGRELNLRVNDLTFALNHPNYLNYIKSIFSNSTKDDLIESKFAPESLIPILTHESSFNNSFLEECFQDKISMVYCLRDPLFCVDNYAHYISRIVSDPRENTPKIIYRNIEYPWYAIDCLNEFDVANETEKSIISLKYFLESLEIKLKGITSRGNNISKIIFFEEISMNTDMVFYDLINFLKCSINNRRYKKIKRLNKVPRNSNKVIDGYWSKVKNTTTTQSGDDDEILLTRIKGQVKEKYFEELNELRITYFRLRDHFSIFNQKINI